MYRRAKRRVSQGVWYPTTQDPTAIGATVVAPGNTTVVTNGVLIASSLDQPANVSTAAAGTTAYEAGNLAAVLRVGHMVKRIVGSVFVDASTNEECYACFGIIVDRTDQTGALANLAAWSPFSENSVQKRWIFRRTWKLGNSPASIGAGYVQITSNRQYGSIREGTQVDSKMKARLSYEERLFLIFAVQSTTAVGNTVQFRPLLRMFAKPFEGDNR